MRSLVLISLLLLSVGCTTPMTLAPHGSWDGATELGPVMACKGGSVSFDRECAGWPLSIPSLPPPDTHYTELKTKAATQYNVDYSLIVLKDVSVKYVTEINGVIRGWKATAIAGKRHSQIIAPPVASQ